jgi:Tannase and feruloyl esterase
LINATDPDLVAYGKHGGKLHFHGWADPALSPLVSIDHHQKTKAAGTNVGDFYRLFIVAGVFHWRGGVGTDHFDTITSLSDWVETGKAPEGILARHMVAGKVIGTRPLRVYRQVARYSGTGSTGDAANFICGGEM